MTSDSRPSQIERRWPDPNTGPLRLRVWFGRVNERPAVVGVELWGVEPVSQEWGAESEAARHGFEPLGTAPVRAQDVHTLRIGELLDDWLEFLRTMSRASLTLYGDTPVRGDASSGSRRSTSAVLADHLGCLTLSSQR